MTLADIPLSVWLYFLTLCSAPVIALYIWER